MTKTEAVEQFEAAKRQVLSNAPFGWKDWGHISRLEAMICEHQCEEGVEKIIELMEETPYIEDDLQEIIDALYDGDKDELAERLENLIG